MSEQTDIRNVERVHLEPGDVVVVEARDHITQAIANRMLTQLERCFPDNRVVVVEDGVKLSVWRQKR